MIPVPSSYRVYLSTGVTDMRRGMPGLSLQVQEALGRDPHICVGCDYVAARFGGT
ncbi:MAG: IS66 family insertion sequence element accessory protein TnpB [Geminicoccaceae bacterium]